MIQATLALLPFENLSGAAADARLARGFLHDLIAELARFPALGVIAADSVYAAGGDDAKIARKLGANYLLKGSVRRSGKTLRISVQLVAAQDGRHLWAGRYDRGRLPELHDEIAAKVANALAVQVDQSLLGASRRRPVPSLEAYECWLRGMECLQRGTGNADDEARVFFEQALENDPHYARALGGLSLSHFNEWSCQVWGKWEEKERVAYGYARRAEELDPDDALVQVILGRIEQYRREHDRAAARFDRALRLAPNDATLIVQLSSCFTLLGDPVLGLELAERALALNPLGPGWYYCYAALPLFPLGRYEECIAVASKAPPELVVDVPAYKAAACAYLGDRKRAAEFLAEFRRDFSRRILCGEEAGPGELFRWVLHVNPYRRIEDSERLAEGLRLAGLEDAPGKAAPVKWPIANVFRREGAVWTMCFEHEVAQMPELRGFHDLARLLAKCGDEVASTELIREAVRVTGVEAVDAQSLRSYRVRLAEIDVEMAECADVARAERLEDERDGIIREIKRATGLGGRSRKAGDSGEKARTAVTWRIRNAIRKIEAVHPMLAKHLENSVRTGAFCSYRPEKPVEWRV
jgi:TolB-like protein